MLFNKDAHPLVSLENPILLQAQLYVMDKPNFFPDEKQAGKESFSNQNQKLAQGWVCDPVRVNEMQNIC